MTNMPALLRRQPVSESHADTAHTLHPPNAGRQFRAEEAGVGCLVRNPPDGGQPEVDRRRSISPLLEVNPVSEHDGAVESEAGLRTIPSDELANGVRFGDFFFRDFDFAIGG